MARTLLGQNVMVIAASPPSSSSGSGSELSVPDREQVLRFAASFLWADLEVAEAERTFLTALASELDLDLGHAGALLEEPPLAEDVDPAQVPRALASAVRSAALRAIAADGRVDRTEMAMFDLLDALLPDHPPL